jgi:proliferating cell nuclear antigen
MPGKYILDLKTVQSGNLRILFEVLKEVLLSDINIIFTPTYIRVAEIDGSHVAVVHLTLDSEAFESYYCERDLVVGINTNNFYKIIKTVSNNDTISFSVEADDTSTLRVKVENSEKNKLFDSEVRLLDVSLYDLKIPDAIFPSVIILPSIDFQKICRDLNSLGTEHTIEIQSVDQQLKFIYDGDFSKQKIILGKSDNTMFDKKSEYIVQGKFNLKFLLLFTKATNLCNTVQIYLENDFPLILEYSVGSLGKLRFILSNIVD